MVELRLPVRTDAQAAQARRKARLLALASGFDAAAAEMVALAASELAMNLARYATDGAIEVSLVTGPAGAGLQIESVDRGPGIADVARAMADGYSSGSGLGHGLPGVRRLMDEFEITSGVDGTRIVARKWLPRR